MTLCPSCGDRFADKLAGIGDLYADLQYTRARWDVMTITTGRGGDTGLPFAEAASQASSALISTVLFWSQQLAQIRASLWELPNTLTGIASWLARRLDWLRAATWAADAYVQVKQVVSRARCAIDRPTHRTAFAVGPCPELIETTRYCPGVVWAYVPLRVGEIPAVLRCRAPECVRHVRPWTTEQWRNAGVRILRRERALLAAAHPGLNRVVSARCGDDSGRIPAHGGTGAHHPPLGR